MVKMRKHEILGFFTICGISLVALILYMVAKNNGIIMRWFIPVNSSLWEFGKLMFMAILIYSIIEYFAFGKKYDNFLFAKAATLFVAPLIFIFGSYLIDKLLMMVSTNIHILVFAIAVGLGQYISFYLMQHEYYFRLMNAYAIIAVVVMLTLFLAYSNPKKAYDSPLFKSMNNYTKHIK